MLLLRKIIAWLTRPFSLGFSSCGRCKRTWNICQYHITDYSEESGCFPLCEDCWGELTTNERVPYYQDLITSRHWCNSPEKIESELIIKAVLEGK